MKQKYIMDDHNSDTSHMEKDSTFETSPGLDSHTQAMADAELKEAVADIKDILEPKEASELPGSVELAWAEDTMTELDQYLADEADGFPTNSATHARAVVAFLKNNDLESQITTAKEEGADVAQLEARLAKELQLIKSLSAE